jgi:DNA-binding PadR family transcriptional regulator
MSIIEIRPIERKKYMFLGFHPHRHGFHHWFASEHHGRHHGFAGSGRWEQWKDKQRTPRGDIKYILLAVIAERSRHGYELIKELESRFGSCWKPSPGSVYPNLQLLEEGGYLIGEHVDGKKVYSITDSGRELLAERGNPLDSMEQRSKPQEWMDLGNAVADLGAAVMQVARSGDSGKMSRVKEMISRTKREIYGILAEEE